ncbi:predicted protein [Botrytis cinerea T4]|uniref:Uncharacterized protein n=1 Tax=Botryotinia fuckeliana (strain T4) TaxID=999810 RepID=G2XPK8_BOTF4|nr:predicted protein [Botrytis cinerea T4]
MRFQNRSLPNVSLGAYPPTKTRNNLVGQENLVPSHRVSDRASPSPPFRKR